MTEKKTDPGHTTGDRKSEHVRLCLEEDVAGEGVTTGFERCAFRHNALPELDFDDIDLSSSFVGRRLKAPLLISSMTGGSAGTGRINERLAEAAQARGWAMGLGSIRAAVEREELAATFKVRHKAPDIPVIANLGAVQLNYGFGADECRRAVEIAEADALVLHLNGLQEVFQPEGNTDFRGLLDKIRRLCRELDAPVGVKEVGWGIDGETALRLAEAGVAFIDAAGAGGTSWSQVEKFRSADPVRRAAAEAFAGWGTGTADCIAQIRADLPELPLIGSGGLTSGVDAAKAISLGADLAGFGRALLGPAVDSAESAARAMEQAEFELRTVMFGIGAGSVHELKGHKRLVRC
ncbi:type 2 isopentenyl-diphosphate Delta-isomerase [Saccharibacillus sp. CPCC 101409]|uniref:type 2 isopentenyl-diphosphate Delta-isomerase n=1 Tax=Saccharibacillus sp. CPCC 101409 TaxID=3058041 RepID=UPI002673DEB4|nr:type 2 isopentenyl-diphosphate Delta-isomerase [Saccharibacillus sp. CPCC 101409]MDO3412137.1 type 2 isopentenyl-diphosphate Delta-isomerase [Saccharibacillus sp. CPCC 101409]